ncbi:MAG: hypothetical protein ACTSR8_14295 [Promethearchaeota archaeon]
MSFLNKDELKKKGEEFIRKLQKNYEFFSKALEGDKDDIIVMKKGEIPKLAVLLGLLDPFYYDLYKICDGKDIKTIAETLGMDKKAVKIFIDKLVKNGLIEKPAE